MPNDSDKREQLEAAIPNILNGIADHIKQSYYKN